MPPNPALLYQQTISALKTIPGLTIFEGQVSGKVPTDASGYVLPYVAVYAGPGSHLESETEYSQTIDLGSLDWRAQTICVGATATIAMQVAHDVRLKLTNLPVGTGWLRPDETAFLTPAPIPDNGTNPVRFFLPLPWRLITH